MTQEEKAKAYDEALDRTIRFLTIIGVSPDEEPIAAVKRMSEYIFPELKESEDERIRKHIIKIIDKLSPSHFDGNEKEKCVAWLERQGEHYMGISEVTKQELKDNLNKALVVETGESWNEFLDEQKPAWSEEDKKGLGDALWAIQQARTIAKDENDMGNLWYAENWLESLKDRVQPQPKQEWSEQDERMKNQLVDFMLSGIDISKAPYGCVAWLKSLKNKVLPQPKTEWSEEDRLHYANVLEALEYVKGCKYDYDKIEAVKSDIVWFKSLRPQNRWKPSDEQMEALKGVQEGVFRLGILESLYQDLKKLKEG